MAVELKITINEAGQLGITGPIADKMLCYGLLEMAKEMIQEHARKNQSLITPVTMAPPKFPGLS